MKYIRTYEGFVVDELKRYLIVKFYDDDYWILKIVEKNSQKTGIDNSEQAIIKLYKSYKLDIDKGKIIKINDPGFHIITIEEFNKKTNVIEQFDTLEEALEKLEILANSKKYNI